MHCEVNTGVEIKEKSWDYVALEKKAMELRESVLRITTKAGTGHVTSSFSAMELLVALYYTDLLRVSPETRLSPDRDYFIYSKGHASPGIYCILADLGFFPKDDLKLFAQAGGKVGVLLKPDVPGVEATSGSLGHGLGIAAGIAEALRLDGRDNLVYCMLGDAECREGAVWEAAMHIGFRKLNHVITMIDCNTLGATHFVEKEAGIEPLEDKWRACGFETVRINGHDFRAIAGALGNPHKRLPNKPLCLIADTVKGKGVSFIENQPFMHGCAVKAERLEEAVAEVRKGLSL